MGPWGCLKVWSTWQVITENCKVGNIVVQQCIIFLRLVLYILRWPQMAWRKWLLQTAWVIYVYVLQIYAPWSNSASPCYVIRHGRSGVFTVACLSLSHPPLHCKGCLDPGKQGPLQDRRNLPTDCKKQLVWKSDPDDHCRSLAIERKLCADVFGNNPTKMDHWSRQTGGYRWLGEPPFLDTSWLVVWNIWIHLDYVSIFENFIIPTDELHHFSRGLKPPTRI